ncbi:MAG: LLM class flavin-dependent oxidoreductase [Acidimicrobiales bacterium]
MKVGVLVPTFEHDAGSALAAAARADDAGLDGVFAFDHLWPMNHPERPALAPFPVLAAIAVRHPRLQVGPLVARVSLVGVDHLVAQVDTLASVAGSGVVCALGTGDRLSASEELAYGLVALDADERRSRVRAAAIALAARYEVWVGAGAPETDGVARELGVTLNLWESPADEVAAASEHGLVSWAGPIRGDVASTLDDLARAGATWAVATRNVDLAALSAWRRAN